MTYTDEHVTTLVRDQVAHRPGAPADLDRVLGRGRRRVAVRRSATALVAAAVLAGGTALALGQGLPLLSSAPPAGPSVTLTPDPRRTEALRPVTDMYEIGDAAARTAGLQPGGGWGVARDATYFGALVYDGAVEVSTTGVGYGLSTAHVPSLDDPGATSCADASPPPSATAPGFECVREPQPDGSVLFTQLVGGELLQYQLLHTTGTVTTIPMVVGEGGTTVEPADAERLRALVLDPTLRW
ncbi:hypothetical protein GCM10028777_12460 [Angustibacter speluncae]